MNQDHFYTWTTGKTTCDLNFNIGISKRCLCVWRADLEQDGFSKNPFFHGIIAEVPEQHKTKEGERELSVTGCRSALRCAASSLISYVTAGRFTISLKGSSHDITLLGLWPEVRHASTRQPWNSGAVAFSFFQLGLRLLLAHVGLQGKGMGQMGLGLAK